MRTFVCVVVCLIYICIAEGSTAQRKKVLIERLEKLLTRKNEQKENIALRKDAYQSSTNSWVGIKKYQGVASRAVDGNTNSDYYKLSCTHTYRRKHQYWAVDLGGMYSVGEVVIYNRMDYGSGRLQDTEVYAVPYKPRTWNVNQQYLCGKIASSTKDVRKIVVQCGGLRAVAVFIRKTDVDTLTLCEVEVFKQTNIAEGKDTYQSSTDFGSDSSRAVDGYTDPRKHSKTCTLTKSEDQQYWYVDLGAEYEIDQVIVSNYEPASDKSFLLQYSEVYVYPDKPTSWAMDRQYFCGAITYITESIKEVDMKCNGLHGRYVAIRTTDNDPLSLCEVEVYQRTNLAKGRDAYQSSTRYNGVPSRAVDGNTNPDYYNNSCTHTDERNDHQYWYVDLGAEYLISEVVIYNRKGFSSYRLQNTEVYIYPERPTSWDMDSKYLCGKIEKSTLHVRQEKLECAGRRGQYVAIRKTDSKPLTLCEVKVFN